MKFVLSILFFSVYTLSAQVVHDWINVPYNAGDNSEYPNYDFLHLNGNVKLIKETYGIAAPDGSQEIYYKDYSFKSNGEVNFVRTVQQDSSELIEFYHYSISGNLKYSRYVYIFNSGVKRDTTHQDTIWFGDPPKIDSAVKDNEGNTVYLFYGGDETYTTFDAKGRKIRDSIPDSGQTMGHAFDYTYRKGKIIEEYYNFSEDFTYRSIYWTDEKGNWTKRKLEGNRENEEVIVFREIIYY